MKEKTFLKVSALAALALSLTACGKNRSGVYVGQEMSSGGVGNVTVQISESGSGDQIVGIWMPSGSTTATGTYANTSTAYGSGNLSGMLSAKNIERATLSRNTGGLCSGTYMGVLHFTDNDELWGTLSPSGGSSSYSSSYSYGGSSCQFISVNLKKQN